MSRAKQYERVLGFAFLWTWCFLAFFSTLVHFSTRNDIEHLNSTYSFAQLGAFVIFLGCAAFSRKISRLALMKPLQIIAPIVMAVSTFVLMLVEAEWFTQPWCSIFSSLSGGALAILLLGWAEIFEKQNNQQTAIITTTAFFLAALLFAVVLMLPAIAGEVIVIALPLLSGFILMRVRKQEESPLLLAHIEIKKFPFLIRAMLSFGLLAFSEAFVCALFVEVSPFEDAHLYPWAFLAAMTCALIVMGVVFIALKRFDIKISYRVTLFFSVLIILLLPLLDNQIFLQSVLSLVVQCTFLMFFWIILSHTTRNFHLSSIVVFGFGLAMVYGGSLAGTFFGSLVQPLVIHDIRLLSLCAIGCVLIILFAYLFLLDERKMIKITKDDADSDTENAKGGSEFEVKRGFKDRCEKVATEHALTTRETEVMILLAKGRSNPRIQEELNIAPGTVNVHITNIYKKLDVHSRQALIDLLDGKKAS